MKHVVLGRGDLGVARAEDALVVSVPDERMSRAHARLVRCDDGFVVEDNDSKNGTFVNGRGAGSTLLHSGDVIEVGHTFFMYREDVPHGSAAARSSFAASPDPGELLLATCSPGAQPCCATAQRNCAAQP
jgi:predicted component of type VI protein secretion system